MAYLSFPENLMILPGLAPSHGTGAAQTSIPISLKNVQKMWAVVYMNTSGASAAVASVPQTDALVAFGSATILPATLHTVPIWVNLAAGTSDAWTKTTDATNYSTAADAAHKMIVFEIDPSLVRTTVTADSDDDCFRISLTAVNIADFVSIFYIVQPRYPSKVGSQATYITD
jgi:hypothetical protein